MALGSHALSAEYGATALGSSATAAGRNGVAIGSAASSSGTTAVALGAGSNATEANSVALGASSTTAAVVGTSGATIGGTAYSFAGANPTSTVSVGSVGSERTITNVAAGRLSASSTDAVNGSQLYATNQQVAANTASIENNTTTITSLDGRMTTVDNRVTSIDGRVTNVEGSVANLTQLLDGGSVGMVQQDATSKAITVAKSLDGTTVDFTGTDGVRTLSGVKAGALSDTSTEAVNGSQLYATNQNVAANTTNISSLDGRVTTVDNRVTSIDGRVTTVEGSVTDLTQQLSTGEVGLVKQDAVTNAITVASDKAGTSVDFSGMQGARTLSGVAAGNLSDTSTEAVNGSQLFATNTRVTTAESNIAQNTTDITKLQDQMGDVGTSLSGAVQYDRNVDGSVNFNSVTLGGSLSAAPVVLTNVADGKSQYDAVNFGQLSALQDQVTDLNGQVSNLTGQVSGIQPGSPYFDATDAPSASGSDGAEVNAAMPGTGAGSTAAGAGAAASGNYATVIGANASAAADNATAVGANAAATGVNSTAIGAGSQAANANSVALGQGSVTDRDNSVSVGSVGNERQITNVAAGTAATDAVNVGQMNSSVAQGVQQANSYTDQRFNDANQAINNVAKNAYAGIAAAMAMPNMTPSGPGRTIVAAGGATYKGGSAAAVGATYRSRNGKWLMNGAVSVTSTGDAGVRAQVGYEF
ncbi:Head domain of trimeric autotransporter adhesin [Paraburkholderia susongensis]|uniref:Head domain of trimeric autotransporter adhesin n=2 Tax=Paraburkholderia susongensis TaxID=1515439 RepID=A0A1X7LRR3_9BURK|nr:Head domain of trimeric autotransporter adhesin [Paraburkholderia susongensis]